MYCRGLRELQPQACGKNNRMSIAAACTLSLPCTRLTCLRGGGGMERCVAAARARRLVCTNKADRMSLPFRGTHAPAVQGAGAACVGGARGGRVSVAHEQPPTVDAPTYIYACRLQPSSHTCDFAKSGAPGVRLHGACCHQVSTLISFLHCDLVPFNFFC